MSRILLIDDDTQVNEVIKATLEILGHQVVTVDDPAHVAEAFASFQPDVTLVDYMLPGCSGLDLLRELGNSTSRSILYLATGMADFPLLKKALAAGASSLLSKPYRVADLVALMELAGLLDAAVRNEHVDSPLGENQLSLSCPAGEGVSSLDLAAIVAFARSHGADEDVATHRLPLVAGALMKNAGTYGSAGNVGGYTVDISDEGTHFRLRIADNGPGFDWQKAVARARSCMEKPCASGLQLVMAMADELEYLQDGRVATVTLHKSK